MTRFFILPFLFVVLALGFCAPAWAFQVNEVKYACPGPPTQYRELRGSEVNFDFPENRDCPLWLRKRVSLSKPTAFVIKMLYPALDSVIPIVDGIPLQAQGGALSMASRPLETHLPTWIVHLDSGEHAVELVVHDLMGRRFVPHMINTERKVLSFLEEKSYWDGFILGMLTLIMVAAIILALLLERKRVGFLFVGFVFASSVWLMMATGHAFPLFWPNAPQLNGFFMIVWALVITIFLAQWAASFQEMEVHLPRAFRVIQVLCFLGVVSILLLFLSLSPRMAPWVKMIWAWGVFSEVGLLIMLFTLVPTLWLFFQKNTPQTKSIQLGIVPLIIFIMYSFLHDMGVGGIRSDLQLVVLQIAAVLVFAFILGNLAFRVKSRFASVADVEHRLSASMVQASDRERERIAREIHDDIGQRLVALQYQLYNMNDTGPAAEIRHILQDLRMLAHGLQPVPMISGRFGDALQSYAHDYQSKGICEFSIYLDDWFTAMGGEYAMHLLRIVQECTSNALRHGQASHIRIHGVSEKNQCVLLIENDGAPLPPSLVEGLGLTGIRARMRLFGGSLVIQQGKEGGPSLQMNFPIHRGEK